VVPEINIHEQTFFVLMSHNYNYDLAMLQQLIHSSCKYIGILGPKKKSKVKAEPYESGIVPFGPGTRRMPVRFYLIAVLFILFDIEVIFFLPWAVVFRQLGLFGLLEMGVFVGILLIGYVYAWKKGALEWE
jgi:NADH-quinone oxidoreductase subunit A